MRTLIIAPHMDDEAISCGGLIRKRKLSWGIVHVLCLYGRVYDYGNETESMSRMEEERDMYAAKGVLQYDTMQTLNLKEGEPTQVGYYTVLQAIESTLAGFKPTEVVIPAKDDLNQDHRFLHHVMEIALRPINLGSVERVLEFLALDGKLRQPNYYVPISVEMLDAKCMAIAAYRREARGGTSPRAEQNLRAQAMVWGAACGYPLAEAYRLHLARETDNAGRDHG